MKRCKERIAEMPEGKRGVRTGPWQEVDTPSAGIARSNQLIAQETALHRLVNAMIPVWGPAAIIVGSP
jgi:hypothetical protein